MTEGDLNYYRRTAQYVRSDRTIQVFADDLRELVEAYDALAAQKKLKAPNELPVFVPKPTQNGGEF